MLLKLLEEWGGGRKQDHDHRVLTCGIGPELTPLVCRRGTDTVIPVAGHGEAHPFPAVQCRLQGGCFQSVLWGLIPPLQHRSPCCDPGGEGEADPTVPSHPLGLSRQGYEQGLSRAETPVAPHAASGLCWSLSHPLQQLLQCPRLDFPRTQENRAPCFC